MEQRTNEWFMSRVGMATASRAKDIMSKGRGSEPSVTRQKYIDELISERMTGMSQGFKGNEATEWGNMQESYAVSAFEEHDGRLVQMVGFVSHPELMAGASPDGLVGDDETMEIKCPFNTARHLRCFIDGMPSEHMPQVQFQLWITGRKACNFVSFDPRVLDERLRLFVTKVERDDEYIAKLEAAVKDLLDEVDKQIGMMLDAL